MRRTLISVFLICVLICLAGPLAFGKKKKNDNAARLKALQTIYVDGSPGAATYIESNLSQKTCLTYWPQASEADAILDVQEELPGPCRNGMGGICRGISAQLLDPKTNKVLWFTEDESLPAADVIHQMNGAYQWVLWNLNNVCCKGRVLTTPPKNPKD